MKLKNSPAKAGTTKHPSLCCWRGFSTSLEKQWADKYKEIRLKKHLVVWETTFTPSREGQREKQVCSRLVSRDFPGSSPTEWTGTKQ